VRLTKHIIIIFFALGLIIPKDAMRFVVGFPAILAHFHHHNEVHGKISFIDFMEEHFSDTEHRRNKNDHEHDNLPFSHHHSTDCSQSINYIPLTSNIHLISQFFISSHDKIIAKQYFFGSEFFDSIWQPPKVA